MGPMRQNGRVAKGCSYRTTIPCPQAVAAAPCEHGRAAPALLRVYVGCAAVLYGDYRNADLVKIHIGSGKVSLMRYDDFEGKPLPRMVERVKIKLREQDIDYFAYGDEYEPPFLYRKSRYINEEFPNYPEQVAFEEALDGSGFVRFLWLRSKAGRVSGDTGEEPLEVEGFELVRSTTIPDLDEPCGQYLTFRQLIECGETQARTGIPNLPKRAESYNALHDLAVHVLDPVIDYFGMIRLDLRLLLAGACQGDPRPHRPEAGPARRPRAQPPRQACLRPAGRGGGLHRRRREHAGGRPVDRRQHPLRPALLLRRQSAAAR